MTNAVEKEYSKSIRTQIKTRPRQEPTFSTALAESCLSHQRFSSRLNDHFWAKLPPAYTTNDRINYLGLSSTQIDRNHPAKYASLLMEPHS